MKTNQRTPHEKGNVNDILKVFAESINRFGAEEIMDNLRIGKKFEKVALLIRNYIIDHTCETLWVERESVIGRKERGLTTTARKIAVVLIKKHIEISPTEIGQIFDGRSRVIIHKILSEYKTLSRANKIDTENFFKFYDPIQKDVISYINKLIIENKNGNSEGDKKATGRRGKA